MIYDIRMTEDQMKECGYPRSKDDVPGMAKLYTSPPAMPNNENDRYCRRCGKIFRLEHFDEDSVDACNYHVKTPGFRRGKLIFFFFA